MVPTPNSLTSLVWIRALRVRVLGVVDQLRQVLDRVDVVVRRRRDEPDAGRRVPGATDPRVHLVAGQLTALAGLGALGELDLDVVGVGQVLAGHAEPARRDLLDRRAAHRVVQALRVLAALTGVRLAADAVHGDRERLVRLDGDRAVRHGARVEPLDDLADRLDLVERDRRALALLEAPAGRAASSGATTARRPGCVYCWKTSNCRVRVECCSRNTVSGSNRWSSPSRRHWYSPPTASRRCACRLPAGRVGVRVARRDLGRDDVQADAAEAARGAR